MKTDPQIKTGQDYHEATSYDRYAMSAHYMDWQNMPSPYKSYPSLAKTALMAGLDYTKKSVDQVFFSDEKAAPATFDLQILSQVLALSYGFTAKRQAGGQTFLFRSAPSAGALYPAEIYIGVEKVGGLEPGLFYYDIKEFALRRLRAKIPYRLINEALSIVELGAFRVSFLISGIFFRSSWKYSKRAFRYVTLDVGHVVENLVLALRYAGLSCSVHYDFEDDQLCRLIGVNRQKEACLACVNVYEANAGGDDSKISGSTATPSLDSQLIQAGQVAPHEVQFREIEQIYFQSSVVPQLGQTKPAPISVTRTQPTQWFPVIKDTIDDQELDYVGSVQRRRSRRNFIDDPLATHRFMRMLRYLQRTSLSIPEQDDIFSTVVTTGFLAGNIEDFDPGFYLLSMKDLTYGLVASGDFRQEMAAVCLNQEWLKNAAAHFLFLADLGWIDDQLGPRGYRYAMMNAGRMGQRLYLAATALGVGCCGIGALYDHEARELLALNDDGYLLYLVAVGPIKSNN
jgi:SagB-type dehydrogenase family enzyme